MAAKPRVHALPKPAHRILAHHRKHLANGYLAGDHRLNWGLEHGGRGINCPRFATIDRPASHYIYEAAKENLIYFVVEHDI